MRKSSAEWNVYRTRFLIKAKQLTEPFSFVDVLGREHHGNAGDYLVESSDGLQRIAPRAIFEDVYVLMESSQNSKAINALNSSKGAEAGLPHAAIFAQEQAAHSCGKPDGRSGISPVNRLRYNI